MTEEERQHIRDLAEIAQAAGQNVELAPELAIKVLDLLEDVQAHFEELAALTCGIRHYARSHRLAIGECVAWSVLKKELGVGQSDEADDRRWEAYRGQEGTAYANYYKPRKR